MNYRIILNSLQNMVDFLTIISTAIVVMICFRSHLKNKNKGLLILGITGILYLLLEIYGFSMALIIGQGKSEIIPRLMDYLWPIVIVLCLFAAILFPIGVFLIAKNNVKRLS